MTESPLVDSGFAVPIFSPGDDPIACLNKAMTFLTAVASSSTGYKSNATSSGGYNLSREARVVKCYNCQGVPDSQAVQTIIPNNDAFQIEDFDTYDYDCDDISNAKVILMANISNYGYDVISEEKIALKEQVDSLEQNLSQFSKVNLKKRKISYQNPFHLKKAQRIKPTLYDGIVMSDKHIAMHVIDDEETLILEEDSRSRMSEKEKDPEAIKQNISHKPIDYEKLNRLTKDFRKRFTPQQELSAKQAFWLRMSDPTSKPSDALLVKIEAPKEIPKIRLVNESLKMLKFHLAKFDNVLKIRTTPNARIKDIFNVFDRDLLNEIMEVQTVFDQMDTAVQQFSVDKQCLEIAKMELFFENDRLLQQIMSQDVLLTVMNSMSLIGDTMNKDGNRKGSCNLEAELLKSQNAFNDLLKSHSQLEKHYVSLECSIQLNQEIFQKCESCDNQNALEIPEFFVNNNLKAQLQDKDSTICKLQDIIKSLREKSKEENVNYDYGEIERKMWNYRIFDSIKKTRVRTKEQNDSLIDKLNLKSAENKDLKAQIQDKVFVITLLKNDLQRIKGKEIVNIAAQKPSANTIVPGMFKPDLEPLAPRLLKNREIHLEYLKNTQEQDDILRGIVEQDKAKQPLDNAFVSLEKSNKNVIGLRISTSYQSMSV
nr:hypothetical protein [Tanacetum cinerariifolium]